MNIFTLPDYLTAETNCSIQLFDYESTTEHLNNKINLTKNTFSFLQEGFKKVSTSHQPISITNDAFLIMKSGHCLMTENLSEHHHFYRSILLFFSDEALFQFLEKHQITSKRIAATTAAKSCVYDDFICSFVKSLEDIHKLPQHVQQQLLQVKLEEILLYLVATKGPDFLLFLIASKDDQTSHFINVVESNKLNKLTLKELAFLANMSVSTFKREFEKHFQQSPIKWFQQQRLEHAAFLLKNEAKRPSDIFEAIGYENLSNFVYAFKTKFGVTPKQYQLQD
ncbi:exoenzyme S synthesis regulatory protein ExsA [Kordia sp. SMS9]|uniref:helix-turn-helix transcriptional regulator n=1 Tax=Kordia sp. SMS9 TaxID=2282170 RepID=UPI000E0D20C1|nr:AraC family transcriptional regulator [Kordia sp. SMS9]AXG68844.1 exoenzyme S synthesis regulatory protein ExsA [Kordia sp. SMS9]